MDFFFLKEERVICSPLTNMEKNTPESNGPQCSLEHTAMYVCEEDCDLKKLSFSQPIEALCQGVFLMWFSMLLVLVSVSVLFHFLCV